ncbi:MAG: NADH-quinone oxidoreductase subunit N [Alphaproteobacteria bacterium RIFOXYD12_FULL_60_8]|nr:MAG: NADH-quinone oxidoreductase subunit N [Alphaproteobacteria bacterium RIFOXYD12_FULL_60_8]
MLGIQNLNLAGPEILLTVAAMVLLMIGAFRCGDSSRLVGLLAVIAMVTAGVMVIGLPKTAATTFNQMFAFDGFIAYTKVLVLAASVVTLLLALPWLEREKIARFEFPVVVLFATTGMLMMISANNLMSLYLGLELQSLALYVLAAFNRDNLRSTESGVKYFVLGALASGLLLFGMSFIYGFTGTTDFSVLSALTATQSPSVGVVVGLAFILAGLSFKISAVPFHMWTPDVYEGAPTPVTAFFAVAPKIAALALIIRVAEVPFGGAVASWQQIIIVLSILSMALGAYAAIQQTNIKRMMAYSSIGHVGYALIGLASNSADGVKGILVYLTLYVFMNVGAFAVILSMRRNGAMVEGIDDLAGLSKTNPFMALALSAMMFSMAGIPPLAGFFGKLYVFLAAIESGLYTLAVIGVLTSVVGCFYYIRLVKVMYFDEPVEGFDKPNTTVKVLLTVATAVVLFFFVVPAPLLNSAQAAAAVLFAG